MQDERSPATAERRYGVAVDDVAIIPLAALGVALKTLARWAWELLVHVVDFIFPILLQIVRFLMFTVRILGDGVSALLRFVIKFLPLPGARRQAWREAVARAWSWLRRKISFKAFEEWVHHLFEDGMAWTFRTCRRLSPGGALLVILFSLFWIPVSFTAATAVHAWLIADAATLPKWMQIFHVVAAVLAKSKLLMLPAYPAAWPQAKKHPIMQAAARAWRFVAHLRVVDKASYRFGQIESACDRFVVAWGLDRAWRAAGNAINATIAAIDAAFGAVLRPAVRVLARVPVMNSVVRSYEAHYDRANRAPQQRLSQKIKDFYQRWEIKFTPAYYEAKEKEKAAAQSAAATARTSGPAL
ncbi:MAG: hypothetical protein U1F37_14370 [Alphaproteobacteria bacterium]